MSDERIEALEAALGAVLDEVETGETDVVNPEWAYVGWVQVSLLADARAVLNGGTAESPTDPGLASEINREIWGSTDGALPTVTDVLAEALGADLGDARAVAEGLTHALYETAGRASFAVCPDGRICPDATAPASPGASTEERET